MTQHLPPDVARLIPEPLDDQRQRDREEHARQRRIEQALTNPIPTIDPRTGRTTTNTKEH